MERKPILNNSVNSLNNSTKENKSECAQMTLSTFGFLNKIKKRHVLTLYAFFGFFFAYCIRADLSVAIVDMSKSHHNQQMSFVQNNNSNNNTSTIIIPSANWSPLLQGYILASFFYGYLFTQLPAALLTSKYGGKLFFGVGIGLCSFLNLLTPLSVYMGPTFLIALRVLQGLAQGFIFPAMHSLWSKWSPPFERARLATFALSGSYLGSVAALSLGGFIGSYWNWQAIFYIFGIAGIVWAVLWFYNIYESPFEHETIGQEEKLFIESTLAFSDNTNIPWLDILKSKAVWAIVFAHFAENWGFYTMLTEMPTFLSEILNFEIGKAGLLSSIPYLLMALVLYSSGLISDYLIERKFTYTMVRKMFCCFGLVVQSVFMLLMIITTNGIFLITSVSLAIGLGGLAWASFGVNHLDVGGGYANVLMSVSNTFASLPGIISPILTGHLIENRTKYEWNLVFIISAVIYLLGAVLFGILGTGETQHWATSKKEAVQVSYVAEESSENHGANEKTKIINTA